MERAMPKHKRLWGLMHLIGLSVVGSLSWCLLVPVNSVKAQILPISPDNTLPTPTEVTESGNEFKITGGTQVDSNLFHSFDKFSVPTNHTAFFNNNLSIQNIFSRVTGGSMSNINGLIKANGTANLFLLNPSGIMFGHNASLNIGGSFLATTADSVVFDNGYEFSATAPQAAALLTVNIPIGLNFRDNPGPIEVQGSTLQVTPGNTLALIGGDVFLDGSRLKQGENTLKATSGRIELGGLAETGTLTLKVKGNELSLTFPSEVARANVRLENSSSVNVRAEGAEGGGDIAINAQNVEILGSSDLRAGIERGMGAPGVQSGDIVIDATGVITIAGNDSFIINSVRGNAVGNAGNIKIQTSSLLVNNRGEISVFTFGQGDGGNIVINATQQVSLDQGQVNNAVGSGATGDAGNIKIQTGLLLMNNEGQISASTFGQGDGGNIVIDASEQVSLDRGIVSSGVFSQANGAGGNIKIQTGSLFVKNGGAISTDTQAKGKAGNITIEASISVILNGVAPPEEGGFSSRLFASTEAGAEGQGGDISVTTPSLLISDGAVISARSRSNFNGGKITVNVNTLEITGGGQILTTAFSRGNAGNITVNAREQVILSGTDPTFSKRFKEVEQVAPQFDTTAEFLIDPVGPFSGLFANTAPGSSGNGGNIFIDPINMVISDGARVSVNSQGSGIGGNIVLATGFLTLDQGTITAETASTDGGNINLDIQELLVLSNGSSITARAGTAQGAGNGGNIDITTPFLIAFPDNNQITANAFLGNGGKININTNFIFGAPDFLEISASSQLGLAGTVAISSAEIEPNRGLVELPENVVDPNEQIAQNPCKKGRGSKFVITGRGGLPPSLSEDLSSEATQVRLVEPAPMESRETGEQRNREAEAKNSTQKPIIPARGWIFNDKGEVVLVAYDTTKSGVQRYRHKPAQCSAP